MASDPREIPPDDENELFSFDRNAEAAPASPASEQVAPAVNPSDDEFDDIDDDLFSFDDLIRDSADGDLAKNLGAELDRALEDTTQNAPAPVAPTTAAVRPTAPVAAAPVTPVGPTDPTGPTGPGSPAAGPQPRPSLPSRLRLVIAVMIVLNLILVGVSWRSESSTRRLIEDLTETRAPRTASTTTAAASHVDTRELPIAGPRAEGYETIDEAGRAIARGEFRAAREMLFSLLTIIDRVEEPARYDVEARAAFLIADAYRLEADALDGAQAEDQPAEERP